MNDSIKWTGDNLTDVITFMETFGYQVQVMNNNKTLTFNNNSTKQMIMIKLNQTVEYKDSKVALSRG